MINEICYISNSGFVTIMQDTFPNSPRDIHEPLSKIFTWDKTYSSPDSVDCAKDKFFKFHSKTDNIIFPIYCNYSNYDYHLEMDRISTNVPDGYIFIEKEVIRKEYKVKKITDKILTKVIDVFEAELEEYNNWSNGNVFGAIKYNFSYEEVDSCWGFYGDDFETNGIYDNFGKPIRFIKEGEEIEDFIENFENVNNTNFLNVLMKEFQICDLDEIVEIKFDKCSPLLYLKDNLIREVFETVDNISFDKNIRNKVKRIYNDLISNVVEQKKSF